jgi:tyrosine-protein phosphatase SIW14
MRSHPYLWVSLGLALSLYVPIEATAPAPSAASPRARTIQSPAPAGTAHVGLHGLPNFGIVSPQLYRGGQPKDTGFAELKRLGVDIVVNLRHETGQVARERAPVNAHGMRYVSIPWHGRDTPSAEQVAQFLKLLHDNADRRVFVHCRRGAERTGVFVASYRIAREHWTPEQALAEMERFRFRGLGHGHLKRFVRAFPTLLLRDPFTEPDDPSSHERQ